MSNKKIVNFITKWYIIAPIALVMITLFILYLGRGNSFQFMWYLVFSFGLAMFIHPKLIDFVFDKYVILTYLYYAFYYGGLGYLIYLIHKKKSLLLLILLLILIIITFMGCSGVSIGGMLTGTSTEPFSIIK